MTTADLSRDLAALTAAIDAGDDIALPMLADVLEEMGDARAAGLRRVGNRSPGWERHAVGRLHWWQRAPSKRYLRILCTVPAKTFARLQTEPKYVAGELRYYRARTAAFLALAAALTAD